MTAEEFANGVEALIREAHEMGLSDDDMITELVGILDGMRENLEPATSG